MSLLGPFPSKPPQNPSTADKHTWLKWLQSLISDIGVDSTPLVGAWLHNLTQLVNWHKEEEKFQEMWVIVRLSTFHRKKNLHNFDRKRLFLKYSLLQFFFPNVDSRCWSSEASLCLWVFCLCSTCLLGGSEGQKRTSDSPDLALHTVVSCHVNTRSWTLEKGPALLTSKLPHQPQHKLLLWQVMV